MTTFYINGVEANADDVALLMARVAFNEETIVSCVGVIVGANKVVNIQTA